LIDDATFNGALKCISNSPSTKGITKKIGLEETQLLLAHGYKVIFLVLKQHLLLDSLQLQLLCFTALLILLVYLSLD
jgi:hypothetical protein